MKICKLSPKLPAIRKRPFAFLGAASRASTAAPPRVGGAPGAMARGAGAFATAAPPHPPLSQSLPPPAATAADDANDAGHAGGTARLPRPCKAPWRRVRGGSSPAASRRRARRQMGSGGRTATATPTTTTAARFPSAALPCPCPCPSLSLPFVSSSTPTAGALSPALAHVRRTAVRRDVFV